MLFTLSLLKLTTDSWNSILLISQGQVELNYQLIHKSTVPNLTTTIF